MECENEKKLCGTAASEGYVIGQCVLIEKKGPVLSAAPANSPQEELARLDEAIHHTIEQLRQIEQKVRNEIGESEAEVFESHILMVTDPDFLEMIRQNITEKGHEAAYAIHTAGEVQAGVFDQLEDEYFRARAADVRDVADRMIRNCLGSDQTLVELPENAVVVAHDLTPSDTAQLDKTRVRAFLTEIGSKTSHSAIMARSLGIPAVLGIQNLCRSVKNGETILVDGIEGIAFSNPGESCLAAYQKKMQAYRSDLDELKNYRNARYTYQSGRKTTVSGNIGSVEDMEALKEQGAQGVGLFRTEFLFMGRQEMPSEEEQFLAYQAVAKKAEGEIVVVRTLDIGGDKKIPYLDMPQEENPFLGLRALRLCFEWPALLKMQIRALLRAALFGNVNIMFPMIGALSELRRAKALVEECKQELRNENIAFCENTPIGMMIEIPSAAIMARVFAKEVDFFSIGTNDLVQYTLAVDRMNPSVSYLYDPFHPAVLELIRNTISAAHEAGIWCGMCGEFAADRNATGLLAQMELDEFSVAAGSVLVVKKQLSKTESVIASV